MNSITLKQAAIKLQELLKKYDKFNTIILDDWRGFRFIYDSQENCDCKKGCSECPLYQLLKDETEKNGFTAGLYLANAEEKKLFGPQKYLNCKSFNQYQYCYVNYLENRCNTKQEIFDELTLVKNSKILYTKKGLEIDRELEFRNGIINKTLANLDYKKNEIILEYLNEYPSFLKKI